MRAIRAIDSEENVLVYSMLRSEDREEKYHWIGEISPLNTSLYGLRKNVANLPNTLESALESQIGVTRGYSQHSYFVEKGFRNLIKINSAPATIRMLKRGRIDLIPLSNTSFGLVAEEAGMKRSDLVAMVPLPELSSSLYIAMSLRTNDKVIKKLQAAYLKIKSSGLHHKIMAPMESKSNNL